MPSQRRSFPHTSVNVCDSRNNLFIYAWKNEWWVPSKKTISSSVTSCGEAIVRSIWRLSSCISMAGLKLDVWGRIGCSIQIHCCGCGSMIHRSWAFGMSVWSLLDLWSQIPSAWWENVGSNLQSIVIEKCRFPMIACRQWGLSHLRHTYSGATVFWLPSRRNCHICELFPLFGSAPVSHPQMSHLQRIRKGVKNVKST